MFLRVLIIAHALFISFSCNALECEWWQTKVKSHPVKNHQRNGEAVKDHLRKEHCREKWKHSNTAIHLFKNDVPKSWPNKSEKFKQWTRLEISKLLDVYSKLPDWIRNENISLYRAQKSIFPTNIATTDITTDSIAFYDTAMSRNLYTVAFQHELAHVLYKKLSVAEINKISELSGWRIEVKKNKVYELPPEIPIIKDSVISIEEDFSNLIEVYLQNSDKLKQLKPKLFQYFKKRFPL